MCICLICTHYVCVLGVSFFPTFTDLLSNYFGSQPKTQKNNNKNKINKREKGKDDYIYIYILYSFLFSHDIFSFSTL